MHDLHHIKFPPSSNSKFFSLCAQTRAAKFIDKRIYANNMFREEEREKRDAEFAFFFAFRALAVGIAEKMARALASKQKWHSSSRTGFLLIA
jgi:hypothetical protein